MTPYSLHLTRQRCLLFAASPCGNSSLIALFPFLLPCLGMVSYCLCFCICFSHKPSLGHLIIQLQSYLVHIVLSYYHLTYNHTPCHHPVKQLEREVDVHREEIQPLPLKPDTWYSHCRAGVTGTVLLTTHR